MNRDHDAETTEPLPFYLPALPDTAGEMGFVERTLTTLARPRGTAPATDLLRRS